MKKGFKFKVIGIVQGVGFRPFVYILAKELGLKGWIKNSLEGVQIYVEGEEENLLEFQKRILKEAPPFSQIYEIRTKETEAQNLTDFKVIESEGEGEIELDILPDLGLCRDCLKELFTPEDRRFSYPFITCTLCGPRFSIIEKLPYERKNTTMRIFPLCWECEREYKDPDNRRFHAEPIACPHCGPYLEFYKANGEKVAERELALHLAQEVLKKGAILALKGLTGFHLIARADNPEVIERLRYRKKRSKKPLAIMFKDLTQLRDYVALSEEDQRLLLSPQAPILLLPYKGGLPKNLNEGLNTLGVFLPYSPLHQLLLRELPFPVIATSGNISEEPIIFDNQEALAKLQEVCDYFLFHNRPIQRGLDDSVIKKVKERVYISIRRARGYVPKPLFIKKFTKEVILAFGAQEKHTLALAFKNKILLTQHIGDLDNWSTLKHAENTLKDYLILYKLKPTLIICDCHPGYETTKWAKEWAEKKGIPLLPLQHHLAHIYSVIAEKEDLAEEKILGVAWDGTGYGLDKTVWGGEFFQIEGLNSERILTFRPYRLIGGERAIKDTRRIALALLFEIYKEKTFILDFPFLKTFKEEELINLYLAWEKEINSPPCSSVGRLFDGIAALLGVCYYNTYTGEAPMKLESLYRREYNSAYPFSLHKNYFLYGLTSFQ